MSCAQYFVPKFILYSMDTPLRTDVQSVDTASPVDTVIELPSERVKDTSGLDDLASAASYALDDSPPPTHHSPLDVMDVLNDMNRIGTVASLLDPTNVEVWVAFANACMTRTDHTSKHRLYALVIVCTYVRKCVTLCPSAFPYGHPALASRRNLLARIVLTMFLHAHLGTFINVATIDGQMHKCNFRGPVTVVQAMWTLMKKRVLGHCEYASVGHLLPRQVVWCAMSSHSYAIYLKSPNPSWEPFWRYMKNDDSVASGVATKDVLSAKRGLSLTADIGTKRRSVDKPPIDLVAISTAEPVLPSDSESWWCNFSANAYRVAIRTANIELGSVIGVRILVPQAVSHLDTMVIGTMLLGLLTHSIMLDDGTDKIGQLHKHVCVECGTDGLVLYAPVLGGRSPCNHLMCATCWKSSCDEGRIHCTRCNISVPTFDDVWGRIGVVSTTE